MRDEDNYTRREWTFYQSGQSVVAATETVVVVVVGNVTTLEIETEVGKD